LAALLGGWLLLQIVRRLFNDFIRFCFHIGGVFAWQVFALNVETAYAEAERRDHLERLIEAGAVVLPESSSEIA